MNQAAPRSTTGVRAAAATASLVAVLLVVATLVGGVGRASAAPTVRAADPGATSCPTDYSGVTVPCTSPTSTPTGSVPGSTPTTTPGSTPGGFRLVLTATSHLVNSTTVQIDWQVCIIPAQGAGANVQFYVDGSPRTGAGGTGTILSDGSGCTTDPNYAGCLDPGTHTAQATVDGYGNTNVVDFTVPDGVSCPVAASSTGAAVGPVAAASASGSSGGLAFTGSNIFRLALLAVILLLLGAVITYVARERRRTASDHPRHH